MPNYSLTVDVPLVSVDALVLTKDGQFVPGIPKGNFKVLEDGVPQKIINFGQTQAPITAVLLVGYQGAAINAMGTGYELRAIASSVIGGTDLMGGAGGAYGAFIGAALIEVIRNSLLLAGVDANWEGTFVGLFIVFAVALSKFRELKSG